MKQGLNDWFDLANQYILSTEAKCHDRRHDNLEQVTTWISEKHFVEQVKEYFTQKYNDDKEKLDNFSDEPSYNTVLNSFLPSNPYVGKTFYHGRLNISRTIQKRSAHLDHINIHYCHEQRKILKEMQVELLHLYQEQSNGKDEPFDNFILKVESDDKAEIPFGSPENPINSNVRPHGRILSWVNNDEKTMSKIPAITATTLDPSLQV